jgi:hypothetical protein
VKVLLLQLDGKIPNLALMRIAAHHRERGDDVELRVAGNVLAIEPHLSDAFDKVYASAIFLRSRYLAEHLLKLRPDAHIGGSGWDTPPLVVTQLAQVGITTHRADYSVYPRYPHSIGFTQRGCRFTKETCWWCGVPDREGKARAEDSVHAIWRGEPWPKNLLLLDNDTFGNPNWRHEIAAIRDGGFKVCWNQGINARMLTDEVCEAIASVRYYDDQFSTRRLYTAWDNSEHERPLLRGLEALKRYGVRPDSIMVYMLVGGTESAADREYRRMKLREFGARPYPMPYVRNQETVGFQRWVVGAYDKRVSWDRWVKADYSPRKLGEPAGELLQ